MQLSGELTVLFYKNNSSFYIKYCYYFLTPLCADFECSADPDSLDYHDDDDGDGSGDYADDFHGRPAVNVLTNLRSNKLKFQTDLLPPALWRRVFVKLFLIYFAWILC